MESNIKITDEVLKEIDSAAISVVERQAQLFGGMADIAKKDLVQHLRAHAIEKALDKYNPEKAKLSTYLNTCFRRRLIDLWRAKSSRAKHEQVVIKEKILRYSENYSSDNENYLSVDGDGTLEELGQRAMAAACQVFPKYAKTGPHKFTCWQLLATVMVMEARHESSRGILHLIRASRGLRDALGYDGPLPTQRYIVKFVNNFEQRTGHKFKRMRKHLTSDN